MASKFILMGILKTLMWSRSQKISDFLHHSSQGYQNFPVWVGGNGLNPELAIFLLKLLLLY